MKTIIAEKPSVAREIARIVGATKREEGYFEGGGYAVTWAFGHLVQLAMPDGYGIRGFVRDNLPIIPETFTLIPRQEKTEKGYKPDSGVVSQIKIIARLFKESEQIIVATDAGREGELIFRYLYHYIGCTTPFVRLWISSLTDKAIREGLRHLEAGDKYDNLYLAAKARSESDWLVGINGTQALSIAAGHGTYSIGRVQTPTLAMVCARYWENRRFTVEPFWQLHIAADDGNGEVVKFSSSKKWKEKEPATTLYNKVKEAGFAIVTKAERKEKIEDTPLLYDLTTLQKEANAKHGFTAEQTLEIAQKQVYQLDEERIREEAMYDGFYAVVTNLDGDVREIININKRRWEIEENFRIMKTEFEARPVFVRREDSIKAHFITCYISLLVYRLLEKKLGEGFTCSEILKALREMNVTLLSKDSGYIPSYKRTKLTDALHTAFGFRTDYEFISKADMRAIIKETKQKKIAQFQK